MVIRFAVVVGLGLLCFWAIAQQKQLVKSETTANAEIDTNSNQAEPSAIDVVSAEVQQVVNGFAGTAASGMQTSPAGLTLIQSFEGCSLTAYQLGDGGTTIGWGRYFPAGKDCPQTIDQATADQWFTEDVANKGERWVKAYVTVPVNQPQFDALVSMAFNLSPKSFGTIADQVNNGADPEAQALRFVRAGSNLERGLRRRRAAEVATFRADPQSYA